MKVHLTTLRPAVAMIELIFALVVMGIALMSAPMLISVAKKTSTVALQQEGINEAVSRASMIMTYPWDQNDTNDSCVPPILHVVSVNSELEEVPTTARRVGVDINSYKSHTFLCGTRDDYNATAAGSLGPEGAVKDDIDDFIGTQGLVAPGGGAGGIDYIETGTVSITTGVQYISDSASYNSAIVAFTPSTANLGSSSNIKAITITLTSTSGADELKNKSITLRAFSCNIGGYEYYHN